MCGWTRPRDWLPLPEVREGEEKIVGLIHVYNKQRSGIKLGVCGRAIIDWGDGYVEDNMGILVHVYNFKDLDPATETSSGAKQVIVTITPQPEGVGLYSFGIYPERGKGYPEWKDVVIAGEGIRQLSFNGFSVGNAPINYDLEHFAFIGKNSITDFSKVFDGCHSLRAVTQLDTSQGTKFDNMFGGCKSLQYIPDLDVGKGTSFVGMFYRCSSLQTIPPLDTSNGTTFDNMFSKCQSLSSIPYLDTSKGANFRGMFLGCHSLRTIPELDTSNGIFFSSMFRDCYNLTSLPPLDISRGLFFKHMFCNCHRLKSASSLILKGGEIDGMFVNCHSLEDVPPIKAQRQYRSVFHNCCSLRSIPMP